MPISKVIAKVVAYKKEATWGQLAGATGGKQLRRVTADFNLEKETYESNEIRTDRQTADFRHGVRSAAGNLSGELSPKTYLDFMAAVVARDFSAVTALSGLSVTIAASGDLYTITRSAGSFIADGIKVGNVVRLTGTGLQESQWPTHSGWYADSLRSTANSTRSSAARSEAVKTLQRELYAFLGAIRFLTRIPVSNRVPHSPEQLNHAARYFPAVGIIVGLVSAIAFSVASVFSRRLYAW